MRLRYYRIVLLPLSLVLGARVKLSKGFVFLVLCFSMLLPACTTTKHKNTLGGKGFACFEEPSDSGKQKQTYYLCVFELNRSSPFYDEANRVRILNSFLGPLGGECKVIREWEMIDANNHVEHSMVLINYRVHCGNGT